jgi:hypothetical protein
MRKAKERWLGREFFSMTQEEIASDETAAGW